jgi:hypothetical protein
MLVYYSDVFETPFLVLRLSEGQAGASREFSNKAVLSGISVSIGQGSTLSCFVQT